MTEYHGKERRNGGISVDIAVIKNELKHVSNTLNSLVQRFNDHDTKEDSTRQQMVKKKDLADHQKVDYMMFTVFSGFMLALLVGVYFK